MMDGVSYRWRRVSGRQRCCGHVHSTLIQLIAQVQARTPTGPGSVAVIFLNLPRARVALASLAGIPNLKCDEHEAFLRFSKSRVFGKLRSPLSLRACCEGNTVVPDGAAVGVRICSLLTPLQWANWKKGLRGLSDSRKVCNSFRLSCASPACSKTKGAGWNFSQRLHI